MLVDPFPGDAAVRLWVLGYGSPAVVQVMRVINYFGNWRLLLPGTLLIFFVFPKARARWWVWIALMIAAPAAEGLLKILVGRARPEEASMGFPSGHATAAAAFFGAVVYLAAALPARVRVLVRAASILLIALVCFARIILRAHWPVDTFAGIALGLALASLASLLADRDERATT
ncbi:MAG: phosphatase PAP2 family protein [Actinobacteria bacterium]|nr:MAG: phosphatase PAP2 family protein [Actinomycetota bacterium]